MDRPLRIVQAAAFPFPSPQGSQVYVRGMARALARRGHTVTVACYAHGLGAPDPEYAVVRTPAVPGYNNLRAGPDAIKPLLDLALAARIARIPADLVHAHNYEAPLAAALARLRTGTPIVYNAHNTMSEELPTYFRGRVLQTAAQWTGALLDRSVPRLADHALALDEAVLPALRRWGCRRVSVIQPGVDPAEFDGVAPMVLPGGPWVVYAGNPDAYQDLDVLIAAMAQVPEAGLLLVSASGLDAWTRTGLPRLRCVVTADFAEVCAFIAGASVAALPRAVCSGYPIKLLNYLALGVPTVAAAGSARPLPGVVRVPNRDPDAMAAALRALLRTPERARALGAEGRAHVLQRCTWDARAAELESLYREILTPAHGRPLIRRLR